jgi:hypothetical protein
MILNKNTRQKDEVNVPSLRWISSSYSYSSPIGVEKFIFFNRLDFNTIFKD